MHFADEMSQIGIDLCSAVSVEVRTDFRDVESYVRDWRRRYPVTYVPVALPRSTQEVSRVLRYCFDREIAVVPQGGNTGLSGGAIPLPDRPSIILNTSKLDHIHEVDDTNYSVTVGAGCILDNLNAVLSERGMHFPIQLGSSGSCQIGGLVSTNAGGINAIRYGVVRDLVLGLEVVLPDGRIWNGLKKVRKDNSGYSLKQLFIGAEGTLGVVTAACLKIVTRPAFCISTMIALNSVADAVTLFYDLQRKFYGSIEAFELISAAQLQCVMEEMDFVSPIELGSDWYVIAELSSFDVNSSIGQGLEDALAAALEGELIENAVICTDLAKADKIWQIRHSVSEANVRKGFTVASDTCVPTSSLPEFIARAAQELSARLENARIHFTGHLGDGNIHISVIFDRSVYATDELREAGADIANDIIQKITFDHGGVISAEHGVGLAYINQINKYKSNIDINIMSSLKEFIDKKSIMNPGKVLSKNIIA